MNLQHHINDKLLIFDFDGVICNSTKECFITTINTYNKINFSNTQYHFESQIPKKFSEFYEKFLVKRNYIKGAGQYYFLSENIFNNKNFKFDISNMTKQEKEYSHELDIFKRNFYDLRNEFKNNDYKQWISSHHIYHDVINFIKSVMDKNLLKIATLKDKKSVLDILGSVDISLNEDDILDQSQIKSKKEAILSFIDKYNKKPSDTYFIDDNIDHLLPLSDLNCNIFLSTWNHLDDEFVNIAKSNNINILRNIRELS